MDRLLGEFIKALRESGVRISTAESVDAINTVKLIGYRDRETLKCALGAALAKTCEEKEVFGQCFDLFFSLDFLAKTEKISLDTLEESVWEELSLLSQLLLAGDIPGLTALLREAGQAANISKLKLFTQKGVYTRKIMDHIGFDNLTRDIERFSGEPGPVSQKVAAALEEAGKNLMEQVAGYVRQQYDLFTPSRTMEIVDRHLRSSKIFEIDRRYAAQMRRIIDKMAKRLYSRYSRRLKSFKRGGLDLRKTLRRNSAYQGFIFNPQWKTKKIDRAEVFVICDVSRSVREVSSFMLMFVYSLNKALARVRSFVLCSNLVEVTHIFDKFPAEEALERIYNSEGLGIMLGPTDYGQSFEDFKKIAYNAITDKTTIIILGDARNNEYDPQIKIVRQVGEKCKKLIWLNPEHPGLWGAGDSEMKKYLPYCHIAEECNTLNHLEKVLDRLLRV